MGKDKKTCTKCKETKELSGFPKDRSRKDGHTSQCKACRRSNQDRPEARERRKKLQKAYANTDKRKQYLEEYYSKEENRARRNSNSLRHFNKKRAESPAFRLQCIVGTAVWRGLKGLRKTCSTFEALPYTPEQLKEHLESQFEDWMNWDNYGDWHVDHIFPQSLLPYDSFDHPNFIRCWSLDNLDS